MADKWKCPVCEHKYGDPRYIGPDNHYLTFRAPKDDKPRVWEGCEMCWDCWSCRWELWKLELRLPYDRRKHRSADKYLKAAYLLHLGYFKTEVARAIGVHRNTISSWCRRISTDSNLFSKIQSFIVQNTARKLRTIQRGA